MAVKNALLECRIYHNQLWIACRHILCLSTGRKLSQDGWTPMHYAAHLGRTECVKTLVVAGADVNVMDVSGSVFAA